MKTLNSALMMTLVSLLGGSGFVAAQSIPSSYEYIESAHEFGVFAGFVGSDEGRFDIGPEPGPVFGGRYAVELTGPLSFDAVAGALVTERKIIDRNRAEGSQTIGRADVLLTSFDARMKFSLPGRRTWNGLSPYALVGGGLVFDLASEPPENEELTVPDDAFEFGNSFTGILGAGVRWFPSERLMFRIDGTFTLWQLDTPTGYLDTSRNLFDDPPPENEWVAAMGLTFGVALRR